MSTLFCARVEIIISHHPSLYFAEFTLDAYISVLMTIAVDRSSPGDGARPKGEQRKRKRAEDPLAGVRYGTTAIEGILQCIIPTLSYLPHHIAPFHALFIVSHAAVRLLSAQDGSLHAVSGLCLAALVARLYTVILPSLDFREVQVLSALKELQDGMTSAVWEAMHQLHNVEQCTAPVMSLCSETLRALPNVLKVFLDKCLDRLRGEAGEGQALGTLSALTALLRNVALQQPLRELRAEMARVMEVVQGKFPHAAPTAELRAQYTLVFGGC